MTFHSRITPPLSDDYGILTLLTIPNVLKTLEGLGSRPDPKTVEALTALSAALERQANGRSEPVFEVCGLDPGSAKTTTIIEFVNVLLSRPEYEEVGVLILVPRLDLISEMASKIGLPPSHFAVLTSDDGLNRLSPTDPNKAQVLFSTHAMVKTRSAVRGRDRLRDFSLVSEFYYRGQPRQVRVLDESILPGDAISLDVDELAALVPALKRSFPRFADDLRDLQAHIPSIPDRETLSIPDLPAKHSIGLQEAYEAVAAYEGVGADGRLSATRERVLSAVWFLSGKTVTVRREGFNGSVILDYRDTLPADLAPLVICDASGRVRSTYRAWEQGRGNLRILPYAEKDYSPLEVFVWPRGGGKSSWSRDEAGLADGIAITATTALKDPSARLLFVVHKPKGRSNPEAAIKSRLPPDCLDRVSFVSWGQHDAVNQYSDCTHVFLCGTLFYPAYHYEGLARSAAGLHSEDGRPDDVLINDVIVGEHHHLILQAACRGRVRKQDGNKCQPMKLYVIASNASGIPDTLRGLFPGCRLHRWKPYTPKLSGHVKRAADCIGERLDFMAPGAFLPFNEVMHAIGMKDPSSFKKAVRSHPDFAEFIAGTGLSESSRCGTGRRVTGWRMEEDWAEVFSQSDDDFDS